MRPTQCGQCKKPARGLVWQARKWVCKTCLHTCEACGKTYLEGMEYYKQKRICYFCLNPDYGPQSAVDYSTQPRHDDTYAPGYHWS